MGKNNLKIAVIARTGSLEHDDRIRKQCITLSKVADVKVFVNFSNNKAEKDFTSYGIDYKSYSLITREKLPSSKFLFFKSLEFYLKVKNDLKGYDLIWCHEVYTYLFALLAPKNKLVWDQHEIPARFLKFPNKLLFQFIEKKMKCMFHANQHRIDYLTQKGLLNNRNKHEIIYNYPDKILIENSFKEKTLEEWLNGDEFVYLQGLSSPRRLPYNSVASVLEQTNLKIVIVGGIDEIALNKLELDFGDKINERIYFTGLINQVEIPNYIIGAKFSIVLYDTLTPNNEFCAPNRLYLVLSLGVPVIAGVNKPMKDIINEFNVGISLADDGSNIDGIKLAISELLDNYSFYRKNLQKVKNEFIWENQENTILKQVEG